MPPAPIESRSEIRAGVQVAAVEHISGRGIDARGALVARPGGLRLILLGPGGTTALDLWVAKERFILTTPSKQWSDSLLHAPAIASLREYFSRSPNTRFVRGLKRSKVLFHFSRTPAGFRVERTSPDKIDTFAPRIETWFLFEGRTVFYASEQADVVHIQFADPLISLSLRFESRTWMTAGSLPDLPFIEPGGLVNSWH